MSKSEQNLLRALKPFSVEALFKVILPAMACRKITSDTQVVKEIERLKLKNDRLTIIKTIVKFILLAKLSEKVTTDLLSELKLYAIAFRSDQNKWTSIRFTKKSDSIDVMSPKDYAAELKRSLMRNDVRAEVHVIHLSNTFWIDISERKIVKKHLKVLPSIFFAVFYDQPYIFWCKRSPSVAVLQAAAEAHGYDSFENASLTGYDLKSMLDMLVHKGLRPGTVLKVPLSKTVQETPSGVDVTQHANRRKLLDDMFGPSPPKISNCRVEARDIPWLGKTQFAAMRTVTVTTTLEFRTSDTVQMLKELAEDGILKVPPPGYVQNILNTGKNRIKLKAPGGNRSHNETK